MKGRFSFRLISICCINGTQCLKWNGAEQATRPGCFCVPPFVYQYLNNYPIFRNRSVSNNMYTIYIILHIYIYVYIYYILYKHCMMLWCKLCHSDILFGNVWKIKHVKPSRKSTRQRQTVRRCLILRGLGLQSAGNLDRPWSRHPDGPASLGHSPWESLRIYEIYWGIL